jgi:hypothetical protein
LDEGPLREELLMHMKVDQSQFVIDGNCLTHEPTGSVFRMDQGAVVHEFGETRLSSGYDYDEKELEAAAREILIKETARCT